MKRQDISNLKRNYAINFKIGLMVAMGFVVMAFNYTSKENRLADVDVGNKIFNVEDIEIVRTAHKKKLPPPALTLTEKTELVEEITEPDETENKPETISIDIEDDPVDFGEETGTGDVDEIEPEVDEEPLDILIEEPVRDFAEYMPSFGECDITLSKEEYKQCSDNSLLKYIANQIKYPAVARENGIEGRVIVKFVVDETGKIQNPKVLRGVSGGCSEEALRVLNKMPKWKPGRHGGRNVKVYFTLPIYFKLK